MELIGYPISLALSTACICLELRPLSSSGITRLLRYYELSATLQRPACPSRAVSWSSLHHATGLPVLRALPLCTCCRHYPGAATDGHFAHPASRISLPRNGGRVGLRIVLFEACSAFTHVTACTLAKSPSDPLHRRLQPLRYLHDCADCYRLERKLPGGTCTH